MKFVYYIKKVSFTNLIRRDLVHVRKNCEELHTELFTLTIHQFIMNRWLIYM